MHSPLLHARRWPCRSHQHLLLPPHLVTLATVVTTLCSAPLGPLAAQTLDYQRTTFLHGFGSSSTIWTTPYSGLSSRTTPAYLGQSVDLGVVGTPNLDYRTTYNQQRDIFRDFLAQQGQRHVLVGHSLGSLVARGTYLRDTGRRPNFAGILAVAPLYQGAPLAGGTTCR